MAIHVSEKQLDQIESGRKPGVLVRSERTRTPEKNARRVALINKKHDKRLTPALKAGDEKRASKAIGRVASLLSEAHDSAANTKLEDLRAGFRLLQDKSRDAKQQLVYRKLLDKADKLAFQQEWKKALKAYQECLFWLSRNNLSNKTELVADAQQKLTDAEVRLRSSAN
jgi:hypothetical protein